MELGFANKRVLVTGAARGIGREIAVALHKHGAKTVALDLPQAKEGLESLKQQCPGIQTVMQDLADWTSTQKTIKELGHFDLLVNNAGICIASPVLDISEKDVNKLMDVNFKAVLNVSQVVSRGMVEKGTGGSIVCISSICSTVYLSQLSAYGATKAAVDGLVRAMASELGQHKIRVNTVNPSAVNTDMGRRAIGTEMGQEILDRTPLNSFLETSHVASAVLFLLSDQAAMISGVSLAVDGGYLAY